MTFEIFRRWHLLHMLRPGQSGHRHGVRWHWRLRGSNGRIVASGQASGFHNKADVLSVIESIVALDAAAIKRL
jgi:uncharacterized protein YegP (UPF0339 family)